MSSSRRSSLFKSFSWFSLNFSDRGKSSSANLLSKSFEFSRSWFNTIYHIKGFMFRSCFKTSNKEIGEKSHASVKRENICLIQSTTFCYENWKSAIFLENTLLSFNISCCKSFKPVIKNKLTKSHWGLNPLPPSYETP